MHELEAQDEAVQPVPRRDDVREGNDMAVGFRVVEGGGGYGHTEYTDPQEVMMVDLCDLSEKLDNLAEENEVDVMQAARLALAYEQFIREFVSTYLV